MSEKHIGEVSYHQRKGLNQLSCLMACDDIDKIL